MEDVPVNNTERTNRRVEQAVSGHTGLSILPAAIGLLSCLIFAVASNAMTDATLRIGLVSGGAICIAAGAFTYWHVNRKIARIRVLEQDRMVDTIAEAAPFPVLLIDRDMTVVSANSRAAAFLDRPPREIMHLRPGSALGCVYALDSAGGCGHCSVCDDCALRKAIQQVLDSNQAIGEIEIQPTLNRAGHQITPALEVFILPIRTADKRLAAVCIMDISERKAMERALQMSEQRFKQVAETAEEWIWEIDAAGLYTYSSVGVESILGYTPEEIVGRKYYYDFFESGEHHRSKTQIFDVFKREHIFRSFVTTYLDKYGNVVTLQTSALPVTNGRGELLGYRGVHTDITERLQVEQALKAARNQAESANKAKSDFLASMSHEIRTPMNAVIGFSDILADGPLSEEQKGYCQIIRDSGKHLLQIINDVLDFSRIEAGKLNVEITDCSLKHLLDEVASMMEYAAAERGLDFRVDIDSDVPTVIRTDGHRLRQCLLNLISNAVKFTDAGYVHVRVSRQKEGEKTFIRLAVEDTGIGLAKDRQQAIFEPFTQADGSTTRKYGGTGLGLAITRRLARLLGGDLSLTSEPGAGSTFSLVIAANCDLAGMPGIMEEDTGSQITQAAVERFSGHILVAEDVPTNQQLARLLLTKMGCDVTVVSNGMEAVEAALNQPFDLIFMDIQMPTMNGYEATQTLHVKGVTTPVVAMTGRAMSDDKRKCIEAGCDAYIAKPIDRRELREVVSHYLAGRENTSLVEQPGLHCAGAG